ncbi:hypothetical protein, partial [Pseudomonas putida]
PPPGATPARHRKHPRLSTAPVHGNATVVHGIQTVTAVCGLAYQHIHGCWHSALPQLNIYPIDLKQLCPIHVFLQPRVAHFLLSIPLLHTKFRYSGIHNSWSACHASPTFRV